MPEPEIADPTPASGLSPRQERQKRAFDLAVAALAVVATSPLSVGGVLAATVDTREWGVFSQERIGRHGRPFRVYKVRTMRTSTEHATTVTTAGDRRITRLGRVLRGLKIDELPQLINVLKGDMSIVGPRPDVAGWADTLTGDDRAVLAVRPGITGPASLAFRHEEDELAAVADPIAHNRDVIWPEKVRINRDYVRTWSLRSDVSYVLRTITAVFDRSSEDEAGHAGR